jgi:hypothetical protein
LFDAVADEERLTLHAPVHRAVARRSARAMGGSNSADPAGAARTRARGI